MKLVKIAKFGLGIALLALIAATPASFARAEVETPSPNPINSVGSLIKNLFTKNVSEKKENLEKNKDIRNKLIEQKEGAQQLNIKFNREKAEIKQAPAPQTGDKVVIQLKEQIEKLFDIKARIDANVAELEQEGVDTGSTVEFTLVAGGKLDRAGAALNFYTGTTTIEGATTTLTWKNKREALVDGVQSVKDAHAALNDALEDLGKKADDTLTF